MGPAPDRLLGGQPGVGHPSAEEGHGDFVRSVLVDLLGGGSACPGKIVW
jgi:hypothetical protein